MDKARYLVIDYGDSKFFPYVIDEVGERDVAQAKKDWDDDEGIVIARVIWQSKGKQEPVVIPVPEGECLDNILK